VQREGQHGGGFRQLRALRLWVLEAAPADGPGQRRMLL
jgi:hypothetical protein